MASYKPIPSLSDQQAHRFWERVCVDMYDTDKCFNWTGNIDQYGYGRFKVGGQYFLAHRVAFTLIRGAIRDARRISMHGSVSQQAREAALATNAEDWRTWTMPSVPLRALTS